MEPADEIMETGLFGYGRSINNGKSFQAPRSYRRPFCPFSCFIVYNYLDYTSLTRIEFKLFLNDPLYGIYYIYYL